MKQVTALILIFCLFLSGCSNLLDGRYISVTPHTEQGSYSDESVVVAVSEYSGLLGAMEDLVENGTVSGIISVARYDQENVARDMDKAIVETVTGNPIGAYAVEEIRYELGSNAGQPAIAVSIQYLHDRTEIRKIQHVEDRSQVETAIASALDNCDSGIVLYVNQFEEMDFAQWVLDYALNNPDMVMEVPQVTANLYPETGEERVVELKFSYQNSRDSLRIMQTTVGPLFDAAVIYAGGDSDEEEKFFKLYSFLMGLMQEFHLETSITPAYSLLQHSVGDSRAVAIVYNAMCSKTGLECITVTGTRAGEPWYWNIVCCDGVYYHVDLLQENQSEEFSMKSDAEMTGYVWDFSAYPVCTGPEEPDETVETDQTELPEETQ